MLEYPAFLAAATGDTERAVRLLGSAAAVLGTIGVPLMARLRSRHDDVLAETRWALGVLASRPPGRTAGALSLGATVELVSPARSAPDPDAPEGLTARELEVLALVAEGRTDAEVAEQLVVSLRTVHAHLRSVYRKLDVHTRSAATRYAIEHGL